MYFLYFFQEYLNRINSLNMNKSAALLNSGHPSLLCVDAFALLFANISDMDRLYKMYFVRLVWVIKNKIA